MTQNSSMALYGAVGAGAGFVAAKLMKSGAKTKWALIIGGLVVGAYVGYSKTDTTTPVTTTPPLAKQL
jgi:NAD/NADP transhydrogenase beta subunit